MTWSLFSTGRKSALVIKATFHLWCVCCYRLLQVPLFPFLRQSGAGGKIVALKFPSEHIISEQLSMHWRRLIWKTSVSRWALVGNFSASSVSVEVQSEDCSKRIQEKSFHNWFQLASDVNWQVNLLVLLAYLCKFSRGWPEIKVGNSASTLAFSAANCFALDSSWSVVSLCLAGSWLGPLSTDHSKFRPLWSFWRRTHQVSVWKICSWRSFSVRFVQISNQFHRINSHLHIYPIQRKDYKLSITWRACLFLLWVNFSSSLFAEYEPMNAHFDEHLNLYPNFSVLLLSKLFVFIHLQVSNTMLIHYFLKRLFVLFIQVP